MRRIAVLLLLLVAACSTPVVQTEVTRFNQLPPAAQPMRFTILPQGDQRGSLEFQSYAQQVAAALQRQGWTPVPASQSAGAVVLLDYGTGAPHTETWSTPSAVYGGMDFGPRSRWYGGGAYDPFPYWETRSATRWPKWLSVEMFDARAWEANRREMLFQGRAVTERGGREITPLMPYLVEGLFTGFPGANGQTVQVNVPDGE